MNWAKAILGVVMIGLSFVGFGLTYDVYAVLNDWNNLPMSAAQIVGSRFLVILPALLAIFSLMFMLIGITFLYEQLNTL
jgi:hypothetical protein